MYLKLDTKFNPFTYDEMVKPLLYYKEAYKEAEDAYSNLAEQTESFRNIANREKSPEAFEMFQRYSGELSNAMEDFSKGMNIRNSRALLGLKKRYAQDIKPIENAYKRRTALAEEQRKTELTNPTMLWEKRASDMSLDDFIDNPDADYGKGISGALLTSQVSAAASALAKELRDDPKKMIGLVGGDYYEYVKKRGFSSEAILEAINNNENASPILTQLVENAINSSGIKSWANPEVLAQAYDYAKQGLWSAVGQDESQIVQNWRAAENLNHSHAMARQSAAQEFEREQYAPREMLDANGNGTGNYYNPRLGIITNKDGKIVSGGLNIKTPKKEGTNPTSGQSGGQGDDKDNDKLTSKFMKVSSVSDMKKLNYTPIFATAKLSGKWYSRKEGADAPSTLFGWTRSNVVSAGGNFTYKPTNMGKESKGGVTYVAPNLDYIPTGNMLVDIKGYYPSIPEEALASIADELNSKELREDQDIQLLRVRSERGDGSHGNDFDYIIFVSN